MKTLTAESLAAGRISLRCIFRRNPFDFNLPIELYATRIHRLVNDNWLAMTLSARLIVLILLAAVPIFLIHVASDYETRRSRIALSINTAETLASLIAARQDRIVEGARLLLEATSHLQSIREKDADQCTARLREMAEKIQELTAMAALTPDGDRWCVSLAGAGPLNLGDREYFRDTIRTRTWQSSDFIIGRQTGQGSLVFTYPVTNSTGVITSVLFVAYRTSVLSRLLNEPSLPQGAIVALLDKKGVVAARWPDPERWTGENLSESDVVRRAIAERRGSMRGMADWAGSGEYAFGFAPMHPPTKLTVLVALPLSSLLREADSLFWRDVGWTTLIFLLTALFAIVGIQFTVARPLHELQVMVDRVGCGDLDGRPSTRVSGTKEIRSLAGHFEEMALALKQRQSQLLEALQQKDVLLKEVNHRVKNSLQLVASLFGLQRGNIRDKEARRQFDEAGRRINTVAQIHQRLYQDENVDHVALDKFLREMCIDLGTLFGDDNRIVVHCDASPCHLPTQEVIPVALIANELVTNAFKYGYPAGQGGVIRVTCQPKGDAIVLSVSDDGAPLPEMFDLEKSEGLGMKLIAALAKQLRATLKVVQHVVGKTFVLRIPLGKHGNDAS